MVKLNERKVTKMNGMQPKVTVYDIPKVSHEGKVSLHGVKSLHGFSHRSGGSHFTDLW